MVLLAVAATLERLRIAGHPGRKDAAPTTAGPSCSASTARAATRFGRRRRGLGDEHRRTAWDERARTSTSARRTSEQVLYAIRNGGFSGAIMPENIVVGQEAEGGRGIPAKYSGLERQQVPVRERSTSRRQVGARGGGCGAVLDLKRISERSDRAFARRCSGATRRWRGGRRGARARRAVARGDRRGGVPARGAERASEAIAQAKRAGEERRGACARCAS